MKSTMVFAINVVIIMEKREWRTPNQLRTGNIRKITAMKEIQPKDMQQVITMKKKKR